jgi:hypothetical protein
VRMFLLVKFDQTPIDSWNSVDAIG